MILGHYDLNSPIVFDEGQINLLVIENPSYLSKIIQEFVSQNEGKDSGFILSEKNKDLPLSENITVIIDPFTFTPNEHDVLNRLYSHMKNDALDDECYIDTNIMLSAIETMLERITLRQPMQLKFDNIDLIKIFKLANIHFDMSESLLERICDYIAIYTEYRKIKIFVFINLKSYLTTEEITQLYTFVQYRKIHILMIESHQSEVLDREKIRIIDNDLCEIDLGGEKTL